MLEVSDAERARCGLPPRPVPSIDLWRHRQELRLAEVVVVPSQVARRRYADAGYDARKIRAIPLGVELGRPRPQPAGPLRFLFVGTEPFRKGVRVLFEAWDRARPRGATLVALVSDEALASPILLRHAVRSPGIDMRRLIWRRKLDDEYARAHWQLLPSLEDGFSFAVAEGMALGVPAIVSTETGVCDLIADGENGRVVTAGSIEELADAITSCCDSPGALGPLGEAAYETARCIPWSLYERRIADLVEELL
jgi:glycosyltransferase involved in cell wall biosynthesis